MSNPQRALVLVLLATLMAATRVHHFAAVPDASWAVFFLGGLWLGRWTRWAFPALMVLAVGIDYAVISGQGLDFWSHYCLSPAYGCLLPAYAAMWAGGLWLARGDTGLTVRASGRLLAAVVASVVVCHLIAQGGFYWTSAGVADPTLAGWWKNYTDWLFPYLQVAALYIGAGALVHVGVRQLAGAAPRGVAHG